MAWKTSTEVIKGSTDVSIYFLITSGLTITDLDLQYTRNGSYAASKVDLAALPNAGATHDDNRAIYVDDTNSPGLLRVDLPDAAFASGVDEVIICIKHSTASWMQRVALSNFDDGDVNVVAISDDFTAAENFETMLDGTGGNKLTLSQLKIVATGNDSAIDAAGSGSGSGQKNTGGATGNGTYNIGGSTSGDGVFNYSVSGNGSNNSGGIHGIHASGVGGYDIEAANSYIGLNVGVDVVAISGDFAAADKFETMLDGTGGNTLTLSQLKIVATGDESAIDVTGSGGGDGIRATGGATGYGQRNSGVYGQLNTGASLGQYNKATINGPGQRNESKASAPGQSNYSPDGNYGQENLGAIGQYNRSPGGQGQYNEGTTAGTINLATSGPAISNSGTTYGTRNIASAGPGQSNEGGTNGAGMINIGAGSGKDLSSPDNDLGISTAPTVVQIRQEMDSNSTKLANLDGTISSRASQTSVDLVDGIVDAIKLKTDNLPSDPADESLLEAAISSRASQTSVDLVDGIVDAIKLKTDNLPSDPADESSLQAAIATRSSQTSVDTVDGIVDNLLIDTTAIKAKTTNLTFSGTSVQADITKIGASTTVDGLGIVTWFENLLSHARGRIVRAGNLFSYKKQDGSTTSFNFTSSDSGRA